MKTYFKGSYRNFRGEYLINEIEKIYRTDINGSIKLLLDSKLKICNYSP